MRRLDAAIVTVALVTRWSYNLTMLASIIAREELARRLEPWMPPKPVAP